MRLLFVWATGGVLAAAIMASPASAERLIVKYRAEGPHAVEECLEGLSSRGEAIRGATRDRSDSLDRVHRRFGVRRHKAVFRKASGERFQTQRQALRQRWKKNLRPGGQSERIGDLPDLAHVYRVEISDEFPAGQVIEALALDPHVEYVQRDYDIDLDQLVPFDDPFLASSGSWGQPYADLWGIESVRAAQVWDRTRGEGVVVAVVDSGLDPDHPDIAENVWVNPGEDIDGDGVASPADYNGLDDDGNGFIDDLIGFDFANSIDVDADGFLDGPEDISDPDPFDDNGHGTHIAGTIAAVANNGIGIVGVAPRARIMALKGFPATGSGKASDLWRAVLYAAENGADVINASWSCSTPCPVNPLAEESLEIIEALGAVFVTSAGNSTDDVVFRSPESRSKAVTVGSIGVDESLSGFSNRGWLLDVVAPGGGPDTPISVRVAKRNILSLLSSGAQPTQLPFAVSGDYVRLAGTSMAAPHVSGAIALLRSLRPELTPSDVRRLIRMGSRDLGAPGHDPDFGGGTLDLAILLDTPLPDLRFEITSPRAGSLHDPTERAIRFEGHATGDDFVRLDVEVGSGLTARDFVSLDSWGESEIAETGTAGEATGELARWDVRSVPDGPYTIRFRAWLADGRSVEESTVVGIERNSPFALSGGEGEAWEPALSGRGLAFRVRDDPKIPGEHDLALGRFPSAREQSDPDWSPRRFVVEQEGDQRTPAIGSGQLVWRALDSEGEGSFERCRIARRQKDCDAIRLSPEEGRVISVWVEDGWLVWTRIDAQGVIQNEGCRVESEETGCEPRDLMSAAADPRWLIESFDGETLLLGNGTSLGRCRLETSLPTSPSGVLGTCLPRAIAFTSDFPFGALPLVERIHDGPLIVGKYLSSNFFTPPGCSGASDEPRCEPQLILFSQLYGCWLDEETNGCHMKALTDSLPTQFFSGLSVSGRRIAWSTATSSEKPVVRFCEFDPDGRGCIPQRLGGGPAHQTRPVLDGDRLVWEDGRLGPQQIFGLELPSLSVPERIRLTAGSSFRLVVRGREGSADSLRFELSGLDGLSPEQAGAEIVKAVPGSGKAVLRGVIPVSAEGTSRWRLRAIGSGGLFSERVIVLEVAPREAKSAGRAAP